MVPSPSLIWFFIGVAFLIAELALPGFILIFFTLGSWIAAIAAGWVDIGITAQLLIFLISSLALLFTLRKYSLKTFRGTTSNTVDDHYADALNGKKAIVTRAIAPDLPGEIKIMGSFWRAVADTSIEKGRPVLILGKTAEDSLTLRVEPL